MEAIRLLSLLSAIYGVALTIGLLTRLRYSVPAILLIFVPIFNVIALSAYAFGRSPIEAELAELEERVRGLEAALQQRPLLASPFGDQAASSPPRLLTGDAITASPRPQ